MTRAFMAGKEIDLEDVKKIEIKFETVKRILAEAATRKHNDEREEKTA